MPGDVKTYRIEVVGGSVGNRRLYQGGIGSPLSFWQGSTRPGSGGSVGGGGGGGLGGGIMGMVKKIGSIFNASGRGIYYAAISLLFFIHNVKALTASLTAPAMKAAGIWELITDLISVIVLKFLIPYLPTIYSLIIGIFKALTPVHEILGGLIVMIQLLAIGISFVAPLLMFVVTAMFAIGMSLTSIITIITGVIVTLMMWVIVLGALAYGAYLVYKNMDELKKIFTELWQISPAGIVSKALGLQVPGTTINQTNNYNGAMTDYDTQRSHNASNGSLWSMLTAAGQ